MMRIIQTKNGWIVLTGDQANSTLVYIDALPHTYTFNSETALIAWLRDRFKKERESRKKVVELRTGSEKAPR